MGKLLWTFGHTTQHVRSWFRDQPRIKHAAHALEDGVLSTGPRASPWEDLM